MSLYDAPNDEKDLLTRPATGHPQRGRGCRTGRGIADELFTAGCTASGHGPARSEQPAQRAAANAFRLDSAVCRKLTSLHTGRPGQTRCTRPAAEGPKVRLEDSDHAAVNGVLSSKVPQCTTKSALLLLVRLSLMTNSSAELDVLRS